MKIIRWLVVALPVLPLLIFTIPDALGFYEPTDPWYTRYTSLPWLLTAMYVYPATLVAKLLGADSFTPIHILCMLMYTGAISYFVYRWTEARVLNRG